MRVKVITICGILVILILTYLFFSIRVYEFKILLLLAIIVILAYIVCVSRYINCIEVLKEKILLQHSQLKTIIDGTSFITLLYELDGTILLANANFAKLFNLSSDNIVGSNIELYCDKNKFKILETENKYIIENKIPLIVDREISLLNIKGWYRVMKYPVFDKDGNVIRIICLNKNIDDEKNLEERKNTFVATLIHDLKTPVIAQIKALDLILEEKLGLISDKQESFLLQIKDSCKYMSDLIFNILDTYLYAEGQVQISQEYFSLFDLVQLTVINLTNLYEEKGQTIKLTTIEDTIIYADKFQIQRVITNLLSNSINYGFKNSVIEIDINQFERYLSLTIRNHSPYIPQEYLLYIFDKYNSLTNSKKLTSSSGLGLYLSKQIIDAHNGKIYATSNIDETCTFGFSVPKS